VQLWGCKTAAPATAATLEQAHVAVSNTITHIHETREDEVCKCVINFKPLCQQRFVSTSSDNV